MVITLQATFFRLFEWIRVFLRYYSLEMRFVWLDLLLASQYLFRSPHRISRAFLKERGASNIYQFGETPLTTLDRIARQCQISAKDTVYELGCGSARGCFWLHTFVKCQVVGIDYLPDFIVKAKKVKRWARLAKIDFIQEDMLNVDLSSATVIYLYGTCLEDSVIEKLILRLKSIQSGTKVITVSYPLTEYCKGETFRVEKSFTARFPWGKAEVFLNIRN